MFSTVAMGLSPMCLKEKKLVSLITVVQIEIEIFTDISNLGKVPSTDPNGSRDYIDQSVDQRSMSLVDQ